MHVSRTSPVSPAGFPEIFGVLSVRDKAKGKPFGGYRIKPSGPVVGPIQGISLTQSAKNSLMIAFSEPDISVASNGSSASGAGTTFHQIVFNDSLGDNDQTWGIGESAFTCNWSQQFGSITGIACDEIVAVDCDRLSLP